VVPKAGRRRPRRPGSCKKLLVMVCVSEHDDCGRHMCVVIPSLGVTWGSCYVHPVRCWRCWKRDGGNFPDEGLVRPEEVSSRFSTLLASVQTVFGLGVSYPAGYSEEEFLAGGWASEAGLSREDVVGSVDVSEPLAVMGPYGVKIAGVEVGALSDDGLQEAPPDFIGLGEAYGCLTWVARAAELNEWTSSLGEFGGLNSFSFLPEGRSMLIL